MMKINLNNLKNSNYVDLLSHALFKINKLAKLARNLEEGAESEYEQQKWRYETSEEFPPLIEWVQNNCFELDDEDIFCLEHGRGYFYDIKNTVISILYEYGILTNMGYHEFPIGPFTCFGLGKHTFHQKGIWGDAKYAGEIERISCGYSSGPSMSGGKFHKFFSWKAEDIPEWKEALQIIEDFLEGGDLFYDCVVEEEYASYF